MIYKGLIISIIIIIAIILYFYNEKKLEKITETGVGYIYNLDDAFDYETSIEFIIQCLHNDGTLNENDIKGEDYLIFRDENYVYLYFYYGTYNGSLFKTHLKNVYERIIKGQNFYFFEDFKQN